MPGEPASKKSKIQRKRHYRYKVKCKSCGVQMNIDHFAKHNKTNHEGIATCHIILDANQTTISFAKVIDQIAFT